MSGPDCDSIGHGSLKLENLEALCVRVRVRVRARPGSNGETPGSFVDEHVS